MLIKSLKWDGTHDKNFAVTPLAQFRVFKHDDKYLYQINDGLYSCSSLAEGQKICQEKYNEVCLQFLSDCFIVSESEIEKFKRVSMETQRILQNELK